VYRKHIPKRTCVACREVLSKRTLIRIVRTANGVTIDPKGKMPGRGAYIHNKRSCWEIALKGSLGRALKSELSQDEREGLLEYMSSLPNDEVQDR
jgi:hypothetical protein